MASGPLPARAKPESRINVSRLREESAARGTTHDLVAGFDAEAARPDQEEFSIRELTREFRITARTLRFYEEKGLIAPRRAGQDRLYSRRDRARLKYVLMGKSVGFSLEEIRAMLDLYDLGDGQVTQLRVALGRFREQIERLTQQRRDIDRAIAELERASQIVTGKLQARGA
jgi:DNA-binding transcriptional MerR regulator